VVRSSAPPRGRRSRQARRRGGDSDLAAAAAARMNDFDGLVDSGGPAPTRGACATARVDSARDCDGRPKSRWPRLQPGLRVLILVKIALKCQDAHMLAFDRDRRQERRRTLRDTGRSSHDGNLILAQTWTMCRCFSDAIIAAHLAVYSVSDGHAGSRDGYFSSST